MKCLSGSYKLSVLNYPQKKSRASSSTMRSEKMKHFSRAAVALFWAVIVVAQFSGSNFAGPFSIVLANAQDSSFQSKKIVPFVPSPQEVVDKMIELAGVKQGDVVYDLGSGDGRIVIAAAKKGAKTVGFEIDGDLVKQSRENIRAAGVQDSAEIRQQDILTV